MAIIDGEVVTPEVVEEAKEVATEAETTAVEVEMAKTVGMTVVTKEVTRNVAPEARVEILDNQETMKKITRQKMNKVRLMQVVRVLVALRELIRTRSSTKYSIKRKNGPRFENVLNNIHTHTPSFINHSLY